MMPGYLSVIIRIVYSSVLLFHIPYFIFTCKEYVLVIYDELVNRSLSQNLEAKLAVFYAIRQEKRREEVK